MLEPGTKVYFGFHLWEVDVYDPRVKWEEGATPLTRKDEHGGRRWSIAQKKKKDLLHPWSERNKEIAYAFETSFEALVHHRPLMNVNEIEDYLHKLAGLCMVPEHEQEASWELAQFVTKVSAEIDRVLSVEVHDVRLFYPWKR